LRASHRGLRDSGSSVQSAKTALRFASLGAPLIGLDQLAPAHALLDQTRTYPKFFPVRTAQFEEIRHSCGSRRANPYASIALGCHMPRDAHLLGFGTAFAIDAGGISGHQAIQSAIDDLRLRRADIALAGAIQPPLNRAVVQGLSGAMIFSRGKTLQPFSRDADGTLPGEGGAIFVLKRLKDALRQGDRITPSSAHRHRGRFDRPAPAHTHSGTPDPCP
jgi:hypothetical protein